MIDIIVLKFSKESDDKRSYFINSIVFYIWFMLILLTTIDEPLFLSSDIDILVDKSQCI